MTAQAAARGSVTSLVIIPLLLSQSSELVAALAPALERVFRLPVVIQRAMVDTEPAFDPSRGQYNSRVMLALLLQEPAPATSRVLGVTSVDLFIPVLTHVFGEAQLDGRGAVVSVHRLRNEAYGLPPDDELVASRLLKEAVHEIGHTFGLVHCEQSTCVMRSSTYVEDIDLKTARFCSDCSASLPPLR